MYPVELAQFVKQIDVTLHCAGAEARTTHLIVPYLDI